VDTKRRLRAKMRIAASAGFLLDVCPIYAYSPAVANIQKNAGQTTPAKAGNLPFEAALKKLETIVEAMESEDLPLESLLAKYEEGTQLAKACQEKLAEAELKIQQLEKSSSGEMKLKPLATVETSEA
jgi:exodeoxyribonuclease VII small subunit